VKSVRVPSLVLILAVPCACLAVAWCWLRRGAPSAPPAERGPVALQPRRAERRPLVPVTASAAPRPEAPQAGAGDAWVELNNEATTDLAAGELTEAVAKFERCHAAVPGNAVFAGNLVEALVRLSKLEHERGELEHAVEHLERAALLGGAREDIDVLRRILERWQRERELGLDDWTEGSGRFELAYDTDRSDILHHSHEVLEHLELAYDDLARWFGVDPFPREPAIRVVLYDPQDFDRLTGLGDWAAGVFDGVVRISVSDLTRGQGWREVLVHELVHAFVQALCGSRVPGWLNEGLAQMLEGRAGEPARARERLVGEELFPLEALAGSLVGWEDNAAIARAYAQSLLFVDYLRRTYGEEALRRMLLGIPQGSAPEKSFEDWTQVALDVAFQDWGADLSR
jgi:tetratricopeptide (TPR) repeat protein